MKIEQIIEAPSCKRYEVRLKTRTYSVDFQRRTNGAWVWSVWQGWTKPSPATLPKTILNFADNTWKELK